MINGKEHNGYSKPLCKSKYICMIPGEKVLKSSKLLNCFLTLTEYRLYLLYENAEAEKLIDGLKHVSIPLNLILKVELFEFKHLRILTKIGGFYVLSFDSTETCSSWLKTVSEILMPSSGLKLFALNYFQCMKTQSISLPRRNSLDPKSYRNLVEKEFKRMKFNKTWKITDVNDEFIVCHSYPRFHIVPICITNDDIRSMAEFRGNKRFPSVVWRSQKNGSVLIRCAQPQVGLMCWRNSFDETFFKEVIKCLKVNEVSEVNKLLIIDARHYSTAQLNRIRGGGVEFSEYYGDAEIMFMQLENIHSVRSSFDYISLFAVNSDTWFTNFESSYWLKYLSKLLKSASDIARALHEDCRSVIIHCSDGWDRTPQLTSLTQILLDPYYRSIEGFQVLIEKEWLQFGHKFADRCGFNKPVDHKERSPVFVQWLDCVHQLIRQYPRCFEFNETFLLKLAIHIHSGLFGDFLYNSEEERSKNDIYTTTESIWIFLSELNDTITNPLYYKYTDNDPFYDKVIYPKYNTKFIIPWNRLFFEALAPLDSHRVFSIDYSSNKPIVSHQNHIREDLHEEISHIQLSNPVITLRKFKSESDLSSKIKKVSDLTDEFKSDSSLYASRTNLSIDVAKCNGRFINQASSTTTINDGVINGFINEHSSIHMSSETEQQFTKDNKFQPTELVAYSNGILGNLGNDAGKINCGDMNSLNSSCRSNDSSLKRRSANKFEDQYFRLLNLDDLKESYINFNNASCDSDGLFLSSEPVNQLAKQWNAKFNAQELLIKQLKEKFNCETPVNYKVRTVSTSPSERYRNEDSISSHDSFIILEAQEEIGGHNDKTINDCCRISAKQNFINRPGCSMDAADLLRYNNNFLRNAMCGPSTYQQCDTTSNGSEKAQA